MVWVGRRSQNVLRNTVFVCLLLVVVGGLGSVALHGYSSGTQASSAEQQNAQYRNQLIDNYIPVAIEGGAWGWGQDFPRAPGQGSIDNEYLFLALTRGWVGLLAFSMVLLGAVWRAARAAALAPTPLDQSFAFTLLGCVLGVMVVIFTVFLGNQTFELVFLLAGWVQALPVRDRLRVAQPLPAPVYS